MRYYSVVIYQALIGFSIELAFRPMKFIAFILSFILILSTCCSLKPERSSKGAIESRYDKRSKVVLMVCSCRTFDLPS